MFGKKSKPADSETTSATGMATPTSPGTADKAGSKLPPEQARQRAAFSRHLAATFGDAVTLLMRMPECRRYSIADLEWLLVPPILAGQCSLATAQSTVNGSIVPVGLILWARVSPEVDRRLSATPDQPVKLQPKDWTSGDAHWVITAVGDRRILQGMVKRLQENQWVQKPVKMLSPGKDGKLAVSILGMNNA